MPKPVMRISLQTGLCVLLWAAVRASDIDHGVFAAADFPQPAGWPPISEASRSYEPIGPGVAYARWHLSTADGPLTVAIADVDLSNRFVSLAVRTQHASIIGPGEPLSRIADRSHAELGINADYYDIGASGSPLNVVIVDGRVLHQPDNAVALVVGKHNNLSMSALKWHARVSRGPTSMLDISLLNDWSAATGLSLLTPELGTWDAYDADEVVLSPLDSGGRYEVSAVGEHLARLLPLKQEELALAAHAWAGAALGAFKVGDKLTVQQRLQPPLDDVAAAVGGGPLLLSGGAPANDPAAPAPEESAVRYPVTAAGVSSSGDRLWLVVVDGRAPGVSIGLTRAMLASLMAALGASDAMAFDSGGSSEMVLRHLGDKTVSLGNLPSDGRERALADGLFVMNSAAPGPPDRILIQAPAPAVLVGSHLPLRVAAVDRNGQPLEVRRSEVKLGTRNPDVASVRDGWLNVTRAGSVAVSAVYATATGNLALEAVDSVVQLRIVGYEGHLEAGGRLALNVRAATSDGREVAVDPKLVRWSLTGGKGRMKAGGIFEAASTASSATVGATVAGAAASLRLLVGEHALLLGPAEAGGAPGQWHLTASPPDLPAALDEQSAPDGSPALHLSYDFSGRAGTKAVYVQTEARLGGRPLAVSMDVYGDGKAEWLRGSYRNADGILENVTIARHVDWHGWKVMRLAVPARARLPIVWTRIYLVETSKDGQGQGDIWLRNFSVYYAGP